MSRVSHNGGWIKLSRSIETAELLRDPLAFALLANIAMRARWRDGFNVHGLKPGEALVGDYENMGFSRQEYRTRLERLKEWQFVTVKATNKGTVATIINTAVFDIFCTDGNQPANQPATIQQPSSNHQVTTNEEGKKDKKERQEGADAPKQARGSLDECRGFAAERGLPTADGEAFFNAKEGNGWRNGKNAVRDWKATFRNWQANGWHPSQKAAGTNGHILTPPKTIGSMSAMIAAHQQQPS